MTLASDLGGLIEARGLMIELEKRFIQELQEDNGGPFVTIENNGGPDSQLGLGLSHGVGGAVSSTASGLYGLKNDGRLIIDGPALTSIGAYKVGVKTEKFYIDRKLRLRGWDYIPLSVGALNEEVAAMLKSELEECCTVSVVGSVGLGLNTSSDMDVCVVKANSSIAPNYQQGIWNLQVDKENTKIAENIKQECLALLREIEAVLRDNPNISPVLTQVRLVEDALVPILTFRIKGLVIEMQVATEALDDNVITREWVLEACSSVYLQKALQKLLRLKNAGLIEPTLESCSRTQVENSETSDNDTTPRMGLESAVISEPLTYKTFVEVLMRIRVWAKRRQLTGQKFGFLPGCFFAYYMSHYWKHHLYAKVVEESARIGESLSETVRSSAKESPMSITGLIVQLFLEHLHATSSQFLSFEPHHTFLRPHSRTPVLKHYIGASGKTPYTMGIKECISTEFQRAVSLLNSGSSLMKQSVAEKWSVQVDYPEVVIIRTSDQGWDANILVFAFDLLRYCKRVRPVCQLDIIKNFKDLAIKYYKGEIVQKSSPKEKAPNQKFPKRVFMYGVEPREDKREDLNQIILDWKGFLVPSGELEM